MVGSEASWSLVTPEILATYKLTPRTRVEFGQHGLFIPLLRSRFTDRLDDANNYTQNISVLQVGMSGDFGGYKMVANVGVRWENRYLDKSSELEDTDLSAFFIDVIFRVYYPPVMPPAITPPNLNFRLFSLLHFILHHLMQTY